MLLPSMFIPDVGKCIDNACIVHLLIRRTNNVTQRQYLTFIFPIHYKRLPSLFPSKQKSATIPWHLIIYSSQNNSDRKYL